MRVQDLCTKDITTVTAATPVVEAARQMRERHAGDVIIVRSAEHGPLRPVGIVTDRDLVVAVVAQAAEELKTLTIGDVMSSRKLITIGAEEDVATALELMARNAVRRLPVVAKDGGIVGVLSVDDVIMALANQVAAIARLVQAQPARERTERS